MESRLERFVAEDLWLLTAILTFGIISLLSLIGLEFVVAVIAVIGWFVLTPVFLFWGEDIAALVAERNEPAGPASPADDTDGDAFDELKRRYATGELSEDEFERRLDRLLQADDAFDRELASRSADGRQSGERSADGTAERERDVE